MLRSVALALVAAALGLPAGVVAAPLSAVAKAGSVVPVVEFYHEGLDHYFVSSDVAEIDVLDRGVLPGWIRTGHSFNVYALNEPDGSPVCRYYGLPAAGLSSHFYSGSASECAAVAAHFASSWQLESASAFRVPMPDVGSGGCAPETLPVYRMFNNRSDANHRYTQDVSVRFDMLSRGYTAEGFGPLGVAFCEAPPVPGSVPDASFSVTAMTPDTYTFDALATTALDEAVVSYAWKFGDGSEASGSTVTHHFVGEGTYPVVLTVADTRNAKGTATKNVTATVPPPPPVATSTLPLGPTANALAPGRWVVLEGQNLNAVMDSDGASKTILTFAENIPFDPVTRQFLFVGSDHGAAPRFVTYSESSNRWQIEPDAPWFVGWTLGPGWPLAEHGYRQTLDPGVALYRRQGGSQAKSRVVWRYDLQTKSWSELPPFPPSIVNFISVAPGMAYFPERKSIVMVSAGMPNNVFEYDTVAGQWRALGVALVAKHSHSTEYNPIHKVVLIAGGAGQPRVMYKLDAAGALTRLKDAPLDLGVNRAIIVADPVSGEYLVASGTSFYSYDVVTDTWRTLPRTPVVPTSFGGPAVGAVASPIAPYGVVAYVACGRTKEACKLYLYKHVAGSGTPLPQVQPAKLLAPPQPASLPPSPQTFAERCAQPGVVRCVGFDEPVAVDRFVLPAAFDRVKRGTVDTTIRASGAGSLRFEIPGNTPADSSGTFALNFSDDLAVQFGEGEEFYVQWRQRFSPEMMQNMSGGGWKSIVIGEGDRPGKPANSCTQLEIVLNNGGWKRLFPTMYHSCKGKDNDYEGLYERVGAGGSSDWKLQNAVDGCRFSNATVPPCIGFKTDQWMTFQVRIRIGNWYRNDANYFRNSAVEMWLAEEGKPSQKIVSMLAYDLANTNPSAKYGKVWLLPYNTGKDRQFAHPTAYTWYDELVISRQPIADAAPTAGQ